MPPGWIGRPSSRTTLRLRSGSRGSWPDWSAPRRTEPSSRVTTRRHTRRFPGRWSACWTSSPSDLGGLRPGSPSTDSTKVIWSDFGAGWLLLDALLRDAGAVSARLIEAGGELQRRAFLGGVGGAQGRDHILSIAADRRRVGNEQPTDLPAERLPADRVGQSGQRVGPD